MSNFINTFTDILLEKGMTKTELSKLSGIPLGTLLGIGNSNPTVLTALKVVDFFNSSLDYFEQKIDFVNCKFAKDYKICFFNNLKNLLKCTNTSIKKFCKDTGIGRSSYYDWQNGTLPQYENLVITANYFNCSIDELLGRNYTVLK